jgi:hypothetical protein
MEDFNSLLATFEDVGLSRGTMNGNPLSVVSSSDLGHGKNTGSGSVFHHLRQYEKRKGTSRSWKQSMQMRIRQNVVEHRAKKKESGL